MTPRARAESFGFIEGRVLDTDEQPISGVSVTVVGRINVATSDQKGRFRLGAVPPGDWTVVVQHTGFAETRSSAKVETGATIEVALKMEKAPAFAEQVTVTASRNQEETARLPVSIGAVSGEEIRHMRPTHPADTLNRIPGVRIVAFEGEGSHNSIRQPLCCKPTLLIMEDGVPFTSPAYYTTSQLKQVDHAQAGRVEVLKGPGTAVHGSDGVTGVINFISPDPPAARQGDLTLEGGGAGFMRGMGSLGGTLGRHALQSNVNFTQSDGRRHDPYERKSAAVRWATSTGGGAVWKAALTFNRTNGTGTEDQTPDEFEARSDFNPYPIAFVDLTSVRFSTSYLQQSGPTSWSVTPYLRYNDTDFVPGWQLSYNPVVWQWSNRSAGFLAQFRRDFAPLQTKLTVGLDADYTMGDRQEPRITPEEVDGVWVDWSLKAQPPDYDYDITYRGAATYAQLEFSPTEKLRLTAGARYDLAGYDYTNNLSVIQTGFARRPADATRNYDQLTPKFGAVYTLSPSVTLMGAYRRGFRVPIEQQLFKQGSSANTLDLQPVKAASAELGFRVNLGRRVRFDATGYHMRLTDDILNFRTLEGISEARNNGETLHRGVELTFGAALRSDLNIDLGYSYAKHEFENWQPSAALDLSGFEMDGAPRGHRSAQLTYMPTVLQGGRVQLEWTGFSDYWLDPSNTLRQDGYDVFHLRASYVVKRRYEVFARVINLTDELYAAQAFQGFGNIPRTLSPGEYRTFYAGVSARF